MDKPVPKTPCGGFRTYEAGLDSDWSWRFEIIAAAANSKGVGELTGSVKASPNEDQG